MARGLFSLSLCWGIRSFLGNPDALGKLRAAKLLAGVRGAPPADVDAVAQVALAIGQLMKNFTEINEIDVNPLRVYTKGEEATALR